MKSEKSWMERNGFVYSSTDGLWHLWKKDSSIELARITPKAALLLYIICQKEKLEAERTAYLSASTWATNNIDRDKIWRHMLLDAAQEIEDSETWVNYELQKLNGNLKK